MGKRGDEFLGHAVSNGRVNFWSVSGLEKGDPRSGGCPRRWAYRFVFGRKEPQSDGAAAGDALHEQLKQYERGEIPRERLGAEVVAGLHAVPEPGPDLYSELPIHHSREVVPGAPWMIDWAPLTAAGIPFVGFIDLVHGRCTNKGASDFAETRDPPGTIEVIDWKRRGTKSSVNYIPEPEQLVNTIQMSGYGEFVRRAWPNTTNIRLSHVNFIAVPGSQPKARKVSLRVLPEQCARSWEYTEAAARTLIDVAKERDVNRVPFNLEACDHFGGCPHRAVCRASKVDSLSGLLGESAAQQIANALGGNVGLVDSLNNGAPLPAQQMQQPQPMAAPQYMPPPSPAPQGPPPGVPMQYAAPQPVAPQYIPPPAPAPVVQQPSAAIDMRAQLEAEEKALAAQAAQGVPADFIQAVKVIETSGRGFPMLQGRSAQLRATLAGMTLPAGAALSGGGEFGQRLNPIEDPAIVIAFARDLNPQAMQVSPAPTQSPANYTAQPMPVVQAAPVAPPIPLTEIRTAYASPVGALPPDAPASNPALAAVRPPQVPAGEPAAPKAKRTRKKASEAAPAIVQQPAPPPGASPVLTTPSSAGQVAPTAGAAEDLEFFIDCRPLHECESLRGYVDAICATLARMYCVKPDGTPGLQDIRLAPKESPLAYGAWKGAVEATVRQAPPPHGGYLDTRGNEIAECVANALATVCEERGWLCVRGIR